jgi:nitrogen fixation NifU-like protein
MASASLMTLAVSGKKLVEAKAVMEDFFLLLTAATPPDLDGLGDLAALAGVRAFPVRVKCATLPWHALRRATERSWHHSGGESSHS